MAIKLDGVPANTHGFNIIIARENDGKAPEILQECGFALKNETAAMDLYGSNCAQRNIT